MFWDIKNDPWKSFISAKEAWQKETSLMSSTTDIAANENHKKILSMGYSALEYIFVDIRQNMKNNLCAQWWITLPMITNCNPVPECYRGNVTEMLKHWLYWGRYHNFYTTNYILPLKSKQFKLMKSVLEKFKFKFTGHKDYLSFEHHLYYLRAEHFDGEFVDIGISPKFSFDRWSNSRTFTFKMLLQWSDGMNDKKIHGKIVDEERALQSFGIDFTQVNKLVKILPKKYFHSFIHIDV